MFIYQVLELAVDHNKYIHILLLKGYFITHSFKFQVYVLDDQHPPSVTETNEPLVGVI